MPSVKMLPEKIKNVIFFFSHYETGDSGSNMINFAAGDILYVLLTGTPLFCWLLLGCFYST